MRNSEHVSGHEESNFRCLRFWAIATSWCMFKWVIEWMNWLRNVANIRGSWHSTLAVQTFLSWGPKGLRSQFVCENSGNLWDDYMWNPWCDKYGKWWDNYPKLLYKIRTIDGKSTSRDSYRLVMRKSVHYVWPANYHEQGSIYMSSFRQ